MKSSESKKGPEKTSPIEELTITQELQKKIPDFFTQKKQSSFFASRSKSPSISLKENLNVQEKALFIKTYHDLVDKKYRDIEFRKRVTAETQNSDKYHKKKDYNQEAYMKEVYKISLETLYKKEMEFLKELKELDIKVKKILESSDTQKLNQKLYDLNSYKYPTSEIIGQNAIYSRKKLYGEEVNNRSSIAMTGEEFFKFSVLKDLMEVERKIKDLMKVKKAKLDAIIDKSKDSKFPAEDLKIFLDFERKIKDLVKVKEAKLDAIKKIDESKDFKFSAEDLKIFLDLVRNKLKDLSIKTSKEDPLLTLKRIIEARKKSLETGTPKQDEKLFKNLLDLIKKKEHEQISAKDLEDFLKLSKCYSTTEKISTLETLKKTLKTLKQPEPQKENNNTTKILKAVGDYLTKMKKEETKLIIEFQDEFKQKSNYKIINSLFKKIKKNDLELKIFCKALDEDTKLKFELEDLKLFLKNLSDDEDKKEALIKLENTLKIESKINSGNLKILQDFIRENKEGLQDFIEKNKEELRIKQPQTTTSLFLGFVPHNCSKFIPKEIKDIVKTSVRFGVRLSEEMQKPDTNIVQALHEVVSNINNKKTK